MVPATESPPIFQSSPLPLPAFGVSKAAPGCLVEGILPFGPSGEDVYSLTMQ